MADIVERLRGLADLFEAQHAPHNLVLHMRAGADEIERKKDEIASLLNVLADTRTENMRLRAALEAWNDAVLVNVVMEGPRYAGTHWKRAEAAWEKTRAALNGEEGRT